MNIFKNSYAAFVGIMALLMCVGSMYCAVTGDNPYINAMFIFILLVNAGFFMSTLKTSIIEKISQILTNMD